MAELKIDNGAWVVVCDGAKALVLENTGNRMTPNLTTKEVYEQSDARTRELGTDKPGRAFSSAGGVRSAVEQTDWHDQAEQKFLSKLAARLDKAVQAVLTFVESGLPEAMNRFNPPPEDASSREDAPSDKKV